MPDKISRENQNRILSGREPTWLQGYINRSTAALACNCTKSAISDWCNKGKLIYTRDIPNGQIRIHPASLINFLRSKKITPQFHHILLEAAANYQRLYAPSPPAPPFFPLETPLHPLDKVSRNFTAPSALNTIGGPRFQGAAAELGYFSPSMACAAISAGDRNIYREHIMHLISSGSLNAIKMHSNNEIRINPLSLAAYLASRNLPINSLLTTACKAYNLLYTGNHFTRR